MSLRYDPQVPPWQVQLFGGLRLTRGEQVITRFRTRATDSVFAYLALHLGKPILRDKLIDLIWPDAEEESGRQNLRTALTSIRQVLGPEAIEATRMTVRLMPEHVTTDVEAFRKSKDPRLCQGRLLDGMHDEWILTFALDFEEEYIQAVFGAIDRLPPAEGIVLGTEALKRDPSRLDLRAKLRQLGIAPTQRAAPFVVTSFIGRERELREIDKLLESHRLVTLTGLGGSGKTRLAGELWLRNQPDAWFIPLADLNDARDIPEAIREGLRLPSSPTRSALEQVTAELGQEDGLLILDNFEHVISGASVVNYLLAQCPNLRIVATSQLILGQAGEVEFPVGPLGLSTLGTGTLSESMVLFEERARAVLPSFSVTNDNLDAVEELCKRLDGFPLALEIAAAKSRVFAPAEMLAQLEDRFDFLSGNKERYSKRHGSLRTALDWSFDRLSEADQLLLTQLSIFRGGFTLDAAMKVCQSDADHRIGGQIETLLVHSWLERLSGSEQTRFRLLESIREYGSELLPPRQREALEEAHANYYLNLAIACANASFTPAEPGMHRLAEADIHNLDAAWAWIRIHEAEKALHFVQGLNWYWILKGQAAIGESRVEGALNGISEEPRLALGNAYHGYGNFLLFQGRFQESEPWFLKGYEVASAIGDELLQGLALCQIAQVHAQLGQHQLARQVANESLSYLVKSGNDNWIGAGYVILALTENRSGDAERAREMGIQAVKYCRKGGYPWGLASALNELAMACHLAQDLSAALEFQAESIAIKRESRAPRSLALSLADQSATLLAVGEVDQAASAIKESVHILVSLGDTSGYPRLYGTAGEIFLVRGDHEMAAVALGAMLQLAEGRSLTYTEQIADASLRKRLGSHSARVIERSRLRPLESIVEEIMAL